MAATRDGRVWSWGSNERGGPGHGTDADVTEPGQPTPAITTNITDAVEVKAGTFGRQFIVRRRNGTLIGWGNSDWGQLGTGIAGDIQLKPTPIKLPDVEAYWLGGNFSFALTRDGCLWFWGEESAAPGLLGVRGNQVFPSRCRWRSSSPDLMSDGAVSRIGSGGPVDQSAAVARCRAV